jgi:hypothetical protein
MAKIAPCPTQWCKREDAPHTWQDCTDEWCVICPSCSLHGPAENTEAEAIAAWNTRLSSQQDREAVLEEAATKLRGKLGEGEFYAQGDRFELIFRPGGGSFAGLDQVVAKMACGETAYWLPGLIARLLNAALTTPPSTVEGSGPASPTMDEIVEVREYVRLVADLPCETKGAEDLEPGCCLPCRARSLLSRLKEQG